MPEKRFQYSCSAHQKSVAISGDEGRTNTAYLRSNPLKRAYFSLYRVKIEPFSSCRLIVFHICKPFLLTCQYSPVSSRCQDRTPRSMIYLICAFPGNSAFYGNSEFNGISVFYENPRGPYILITSGILCIFSFQRDHNVRS